MLTFIILAILGCILLLIWQNVHLARFQRSNVVSASSQEWIWYHQHPGIVSPIPDDEDVYELKNIGWYKKKPGADSSSIDSYSLSYTNSRVSLHDLQGLYLISAQHPAFSHSMLRVDFSSSLPLFPPHSSKSSSQEQQTQPTPLSVCFSFHLRCRKREKHDSFAAIFRCFEMHQMMFETNTCFLFRRDIEKEEIFQFPLAVNKTTQRDIFRHLVKDYYAPNLPTRYYHTITNNCGRPLVQSISKATRKKINKTQIVFWGLDYTLSRLGILPANVATDRDAYNISSQIPPLGLTTFTSAPVSYQIHPIPAQKTSQV